METNRIKELTTALEALQKAYWSFYEMPDFYESEKYDQYKRAQFLINEAREAIREAITLE